MTLLLSSLVTFGVELCTMNVLPSSGAFQGRFADFLDAAIMGLVVSPCVVFLALSRHRRTVPDGDRAIRGDPGRRLRLVYIVSLLTVAALVLVRQQYLRTEISLCTDAVNEANHAGLHRLQGTRIARDAARLGHAADPAALADDLLRAVDGWDRSAAKLEEFVRQADENGKVSRAPLEAFRWAERVRAPMGAAAREAAGLARRGGTHDELDDAVRAVTSQEEGFLTAMNAALEILAGDLGDDLAATVETTRQTAWIILGVLALIGVAVAEPAVRRAVRAHRALAAQRDEVQRANDEARVWHSAVDRHSILSEADANGRITYANDEFCRISGYSRQELLGSDHHILNSGVHPKSFWTDMCAAMAHDGVWTGIVCNRRKDGSLYWVHSTNIAVKGPDARVERFISLRMDVTENKRAEEAILRQIQVQEEMGRIARVGGWEFEPATGKATWTAQMYEIFGVDRSYTPELATSLASFPGQASDHLAALVERAARTGEGFEYTLPFITAKGRRLWVRGQGKAERRPDGSVRLYGALQDVTESEHARDELQRALVAAQGAVRAKSEFLANMSHEIRTPMSAILGYIDLLFDDANLGDEPSQRREYFRTIKRNGQHLLSVIDDILDVSRIEAGKMTVEQVPTDPLQILEEAISILLVKAKEKGIGLDMHSEEAVPRRVAGDPVRLRQVLLNVVGNAVKFTATGGVTVTAGVEPGAAGVHGSAVLVYTVRDTGIGMSPEQAARLFLPFEQADASMSRRFGGSGLGLRISKRLMEMMGGDITASCELGRGCEFVVRLPVRPCGMEEDAGPGSKAGASYQEPSPDTDVGARPLTGARVLLAEDGLDNQRLIAHHVRKAGAEVDVACDGRQALAMIDQAKADGRPYSLLLTDMQMPELDGYALARTLRGNRSTIPIVALTAHAMAEDRDKCLAAGCDDYATKPIDRAALVRVCAAWVGKEGGKSDARTAAKAA